MKSIKIIYALALISLLTTVIHADQDIRVAIGEPASILTITGDELKIFTESGTQISLNEKVIKITASAAGLEVNSVKTNAKTIKIISDGLISFGEHHYRNSIEIQLNPSNPYLITAIHSLPLETYLIGTVASEVPESWPDETLKAQAIAARTYAVWQTSRREGKNYDVKSSVMDQVYKGVKNEHSKAVKAVNDTKGQILSYNNKPVQAYFHSNCGGKTENAKDVWGISLNYLPSTTCTYGKSDPKYTWTYTISKKALNEALSKILPGPITKIKIIKKTSSKRAKTLEIFNKKQSKKISGDNLRSLLGYSNLRSTLIDSIRFGFSEVTFKGKGYGHGVGMCQWGAAGMGKSGFKAEKILSKYYPGATITKIY